MVKLTMNDGHVLEMDEEVATLLAETQNDNGAYNNHRRQPRIVVTSKPASSPLYRQSWFWAMMILIVVVIILLTTDSFEVHITVRDSQGTHQKEQPHNNNNNAPLPSPPSIPTIPTTTDNHEPAPAPEEENSAANPPTTEETKTAPSPPTPEEAKPTDAPAAAEVKPTDAPAPEGTGVSPANFPFRYRLYPAIDAATKKAELATKWGKWTLPADTKPRPSVAQVCGSFPHCDVPRDKFPAHAWQTDTEFLKDFLHQAQDLVSRAQEVILAEYGQSPDDLPGKSLEERSVNFQLSILNMGGGGTDHPPGRRENYDNAGWTTQRSFQGLVRRLLHSIMTQDNFTFVMGGHSAAAAHGDFFKQSYTMQFHKVMEPIFGRLGVQLNSHNMAQGGLGTIQNSMAMGSLYGNEIDINMWDSSMTENNAPHYDLYARQALISGNRVPFLWNGISGVLENLHNQADVDLGGAGSGMRTLAETTSEEQALKLPYAVRYLKCIGELKDLCNANKYNAICWINRTDVTPRSRQLPFPKGRAGWHPGFREHQLAGRVLAFIVLQALKEGIKQWKEADNYALPDSAWHVADYYQNIRSKLSKLFNATDCYTDPNLPSTRVCDIPVKGVSEFTPRFQPERTSIRSIMKDRQYLMPEPQNLYSGPDVYIPALDPPEGEINYLAIIENDDKPDHRLLTQHDENNKSNRNKDHSIELHSPHSHRALKEELTIGHGWSMDIAAGDKYCNGTWDSECNRGPNSECLLYGHNDGRGGLIFDSFSGWMVVQFTIKEGLIFIKFDTWYPSGSSQLTNGWTAENGGATRRRRQLDANNNNNIVMDDEQQRELKKGSPPEFCENFVLEYSINGKVTSLNRDEFGEQKKHVQRVVETLTLLDDPTFTAGQELAVELGIRMRGCERAVTFHLTHVYWA